MRGDGVGVGDVGEVSGKSSIFGHASGGDDGGGAIGEHDCGMVGGHGRGKRDAATERSGDGIGIDDGTRIGDGSRGVHGTGTGGADGMRGDGVGVGDIGAVHGGAWILGDSTLGGDYRGAIGERDGSILCGREEPERDEGIQQGRDRLDVGDGARGGAGAVGVHGDGSGGAHGMRGDRVGVGDIGAVHGGSRSWRHPSGGDDGE